MGALDYHDHKDLMSLDKGIHIVGGSSDYTIVDVEEKQKRYEVGDIVE